MRHVWKAGSETSAQGPVHVSMNDYWVHRRRDIPRVAVEGMRFRRSWPRTPGTLGLWFAGSDRWHRQVSISIWRDPEDLRRFVSSPAHRRVMRSFRDVGALITTAWTAERFHPQLVWQQAEDRLSGRVPGVAHHGAST